MTRVEAEILISAQLQWVKLVGWVTRVEYTEGIGFFLIARERSRSECES